MKQIPLTQGQYALVDDTDYDWLNQYKWFAIRHYSGNFYAARSSPRKNGKQYLIRMSREILKLNRGDLRQADHTNHNTLDNRQDNLRVCTNQQNQRNQKLHFGTISKYKGVTWYKSFGKWIARIGINKKRKYLGYFNKEEDAARAYDLAAIKEFGEFAHLNFN